MLDVCAACAEGAQDSDIAAIKQTMRSRPSLEAVRTPATALIPLQSHELALIWRWHRVGAAQVAAN